MGGSSELPGAASEEGPGVGYAKCKPEKTECPVPTSQLWTLSGTFSGPASLWSSTVPKP